MKLFIVASLVLSIVAAAIVQPGQPLSPGTHIIAIEGHDGTFNSEMLPVSTEGESVQPSSAFGTDNDPIAILGTPTTPKAAKVTQISRAHDPEPIIILPFHFQIVENCMSDNSITARGVYVNRDFVWAYFLSSGGTSVVEHNVNGYPDFLVGPYDYGSSTLHFSYDNTAFKCDWNDQETWKECGECRSGMWDADPLDCNGGGIKTRTKHMDCLFIMGWRSQLKGTPIPNLPPSKPGDDPN
jgi:hypothetical protein